MYTAGTLKDFAFESDEEGERPAVDGDDMPSIAEEVKHEEGAAAADKLAKKKKPSVKVLAHARLLKLYMNAQMFLKHVHRTRSCIM